jgi:uncharacterized C2H2 Zn-finger protein
MKKKLRCPKCGKKIFYIVEEDGNMILICNNCDQPLFKVSKEKKPVEVVKDGTGNS